MKWGGYNRRGEEKIKRVLGRMFAGQTLFILLVIMAAGLFLSDNL